jgi:Ca2+-binding RTX toxin-like protein
MAKQVTTWSWTAIRATTNSTADPATTAGPPTSENIRLHGLRGEGGENRVYGEDGADTINAQLTAGLGAAPERIFGGEGDDTIAAADRVKDVIDCGAGLDTVVSHDAGRDVLMGCERR